MPRHRTFSFRAGLAVAAFALTAPAFAEEATVKLFKLVTVKDEIVIGLSAAELQALGGADAGAVAHGIAQKGDLTAWRYNVQRGANGELTQAPTAKVGVFAATSLRVEPYATTYPILPHE
jgi:hypothetical protein